MYGLAQTWFVLRRAEETVGRSASSEALDWYTDDRFDADPANCDIPTAKFSISSKRLLLFSQSGLWFAVRMYTYKSTYIVVVLWRIRDLYVVKRTYYILP